LLLALGFFERTADKGLFQHSDKAMPLSRRQLIQKMRLLGFHGPYCGGKHQFMAKETLKVRIPNPHKSNEISEALLS
jgi:hypothetical protein